MVWSILWVMTLFSTEALREVSANDIEARKNASKELELVNELLKNYDVNVRPFAGRAKPPIVEMDLAIIQILEVDEKNQILAGNYWLDLYWDDPFLEWNPDNYGGITTIHISADRIWRPDITLVNDVTIERRPVEELYRAEVQSTGKVTWLTPQILRTSCILDMTYYPWDHQNCNLTFRSWIHDELNMDISSVSNKGNQKYFIGDGEWIVHDFAASRRVVQQTVDAQNWDTRRYPRIEYTITLERKPLFSFYNLILPSIFITFCTYLVFLLPPESGEKVSMAVTMLLSTTVFLLLVAEYQPSQSDVIPVIGKYFLSAIVLLVMSTAGTVSVLYMHFHGALRVHLSRVAKKVILEWLASAVFMRGKVRFMLGASKERHQVQPATGKSRRGVRSSQQNDNADDRHFTQDPIYMEWVLAAMVLDRLYLWIFVLVTISLISVLFLNNPHNTISVG